MGTVWKYPRAWVRHAALLANVSERTIRRWCLAGMELGDDADILRFKRHAGHPPGARASRQEKLNPAYESWLKQRLAELARR